MSDVKLLLPEKTADLTPIQKGWLTLAAKRIDITEQLKVDELVVQQKVNELAKLKDLPKVQALLKEAKNIAAEAKEKRMSLTGLITDKIFTPLMEHEKRNEALIKSATEIELKLRLDAEKDASEKVKKQEELSAFKSHVQNEYSRIAMEYRIKTTKEIAFYYKDALERDKLMNKTELGKYVQMIKDGLALLELPKFTKFEPKLITQQEMTDAFKSVTPYKHQDDLRLAQESVDTKFAMYEQDFQNKETALKQSEEEAESNVAELEQEHNIESATNVLVNAASVAMVTVPKVKREMKVVVFESQDWAMAIIAHFVKNWQNGMKFVKVKSLAKLSIQQMADALGKIYTENGVAMDGLQFTEVKK